MARDLLNNEVIVFDCDLKNCDKEEANIFVDILRYLDTI